MSVNSVCGVASGSALSCEFFDSWSSKSQDVQARVLLCILHRRSIVFLLTDFLHSFAAAQQTAGTRDTLQEIGLTNARHDVVCLHLHDPREIELPSAGLVTVEDAETGEMLELDSTRST